jgi:hypothetical protein
METATLTEESYHLSVPIPIKAVQYLEWLGLEARRTGGARLSKTAIVRALLNVAMRLDIDASSVSTQRELEERLWQAILRQRLNPPSGA